MTKNTSETSAKLNLGCGPDYRDGWLNVDIDESVEPDRVLDLENMPWPFSSDSFELVLMDNVIEHIRPDKRQDTLNQLHRITTRDGLIIVRLPVPKIGVGWDVSHYGVPEWTFPYTLQNNELFDLVGVTSTPIGVGRVLPDKIRRHVTRWGIVHAIDGVELRLRPT